MSTQPDSFYVAPGEPPQPRRPPIREIGIISWLRENLFRSPVDTVITLITLAVVASGMAGFLNWALFEAQWEIVFNNLRALSVGLQFPLDEVWRAQLVGMIILFLGMLSVGVWGRLQRGAFITLGIIAALMVIVPYFSQFVEKPLVYTYISPTYAIRQVNFVAHQDQTLSFLLDPLTEVDDFRLENIAGYVENDNQQANTAFDSYTAASTEVLLTNQRDPSQYDMNAAIQIWDNSGAVIAQSDFTGGSTESLNFDWTAPYSGWFTYTVVLNEESPGTQGIAWLRVENLEIFRSTLSAQAERIALYGTPPELNCRGCATQANRTDMRFQGKRTLAQWFSLQFTPFLLETRQMFFIGLIVGAIAYGIGQASKRKLFANLTLPASVEQWIARIAAGLFGLYIVAQIVGITGANPNASTAYMVLLLALCTSVVLYAGVLLLRGGSSSSWAVALLWAISFPIILTLLNGIVGVNTMEQIPSDKQGGLVLTLLLSAVAIVLSFPIGLLLALGRQSSLPVVSGLCTVLIEVIRGVPLITLIFAGRLILPFFGFGLGDVDLLIRIMVVLTLFTSAYMAEVIRGGLQTIPKGQLEAAHALGLNDFYTNILIVIPQALRAVIPAMMGQSVSLFKDTSLVYIIGLFELVGTMGQILGDSQTGYLAFPREGYLFVGILYFVFSYIMAEASRRLEKTGAGAVRRDTM